MSSSSFLSLAATATKTFAIILAMTTSCSWIRTTNAQITTACTSSTMSKFTPCLSYLTGSSGSGGSPTKQCCDSLRSVMTDSMDCTCLILTGNVPITIPFVNRNLAISLPQACKSSVPLQCKASGDPLPAPGPVLFRPPPSPTHLAPASSPLGHGHGGHIHSPSSSPVQSPKASKAVLDVEAPLLSPPKFPLGPSANPGIRPVVNEKSKSSQSHGGFTVSSPSTIVLVIIVVVTMTMMTFGFF